MRQSIMLAGQSEARPERLFASSLPGLSRSGLARRLREERAHQRAQDCTTTLRACGLGVVVGTYGEGDAYVPATVVTVIFVHRHRGSSSRLHGPVTVPPHGGGPSEYCERQPTARRVAPSRSPGYRLRTVTVSHEVRAAMTCRGMRRAWSVSSKSGWDRQAVTRGVALGTVRSLGDPHGEARSAGPCRRPTGPTAGVG
jgi:hypothetical protein